MQRRGPKKHPKYSFNMAALFSDQEQALIQKAIEAAERSTSGEIRVCVEKRCSESALDRAGAYFRKLGMDQTLQKNGVLIYLALQDKKLAIIGDLGIHQVVPADFWHTVKEAMLKLFKQGHMADGVVLGIQMAGEKLRQYFPSISDDQNELPDDIVFADGN